MYWESGGGVVTTDHVLIRNEHRFGADEVNDAFFSRASKAAFNSQIWGSAGNITCVCLHKVLMEPKVGALYCL